MRKAPVSSSALGMFKRAAEREERLKELRQLALYPTVLYGAGVYALEVRRFLESLGVRAAGCFVDDPYAGQGRAEDLRPLRFEEIDSIFPEYNVVIAFCKNPYSARTRVQEKKSRKIRGVQIIDCRFWERFSSLTHEWIQANHDKFEAVYGWLSDELSRKIFAGFINTKLMYNPDFLGALMSFPQYFPENLPEFKPNQEDVFVDVGAYNGDTLMHVMALAGKRPPKIYYAFEPDQRNIARLRGYVESGKLESVHVVPVGLWDSPGRVCFEEYHDSRSYVSKRGKSEIEVNTLDSFALSPTFIKMDIEGSEWEALSGAEKTITNFAPKIAVALYHNFEDIVRIPHLLKQFCPEYSFYLRLHSVFSEELVLYAIKKG